MSLREIGIEGYRSIRSLTLPIGPGVTVFSGPNGAGKSNLYRALRLIRAAAAGELAATMAEEGGMPSVLWAGPRHKGSVRLRLSIAQEAWSYEIELGLPGPTEAALPMDPLVKSERLVFAGRAKPTTLLERRGPTAWLRDEAGRRIAHERALLGSEAALSQIRDAIAFPELAWLREQVLDWRFYHQFRTDPESPIRQPRIAVCTPVMAPDGRDLVATLETVRRLADGHQIDRAVDAAFPGARLTIEGMNGRYALALASAGAGRAFDASELSDGTLRYLCLVGALLGYRLPTVLVLNEPETSLHSDLWPALAGLIATAGRRSQVWVTTHAVGFADLLQAEGATARRVRLVAGATEIEGLSVTGAFTNAED